MIKETHRTNSEFFPSLCTRACLCAPLLQSAFSHPCGLYPAGCSVPGLLPAHGKFYFLVFQSSASVSSAEVSEPWQLRLAQQQSPGCLTASGRPRTELLRRYCASKWHDVFKRQSWARGAGQGQDCLAEDRASGSKVLGRTPQDERPGGTSTPLCERGPPARWIPSWGRRWRSRARFSWSSSAPPPADPGRLTGRPGPASWPGSQCISAPRRTELVLSCE